MYLAFAKGQWPGSPRSMRPNSPTSKSGHVQDCMLGVDSGDGYEALAMRTGLGKREAAEFDSTAMANTSCSCSPEMGDTTAGEAQLLPGRLSTRLGWTLRTAAHHR